jgi:replicative DNA helicase
MIAEIERGLIGAVLSRPDLLDDVSVDAQHFHAERHQLAWQTIVAMRAAGEAVDAVMLSQRLAAEGERELSAEVIGWTADAPPIRMARQYAGKVVQAWRARRASDIACDLADDVERDDSAIDRAIRDLMDLNAVSTSHEHTIGEAVKAAIEDMEAAVEADGGLRGITTGLRALDSHLGGWQDGDLAVIGARPAMGKTALMLHFAANAGVPLGVVSAEQPAYQIAQRHSSTLGRVSLAEIRKGKIGNPEQERLMHAMSKLNRMTYRIFDRSSPHIAEVERVARRWHHKHGIRVLFVDYIQRIKGDGERRHETVGDVVRRLKTLARDLNIPVIALSQVGRQVEQRNNRRPGMGDLSDSSEIEKEADQIMTLYRDEVYDDATPDKGIAEIYICKNRHGYTGTIRVQWAGEFVQFADLARAAA